MATFQTSRSFNAARRRQPIPLNPTNLITFGTLRAARSFRRGYVCVDRVVACRWIRVRRGPRAVLQRVPQFIVCHPRTADRNNWTVC